jgi:hypothetical protein
VQLIARRGGDAFARCQQARETGRRALAGGGVRDRVDPQLSVFLRPRPRGSQGSSVTVCRKRSRHHVSMWIVRSRTKARERWASAGPSSRTSPHASGPKNPIVSFFEQ